MSVESTKIKIIITALILVVGVVLVAIIPHDFSTSVYQSEGSVIDFNERDIFWTDSDFSKGSDALNVLKESCENHGFEYVLSPTGEIVSIDGVESNSDGKKWGLWVVQVGEYDWIELDSPYNYSLSDYVVSSWAYRADGELPTVGVDASGKSIYGYSQANRVVALTPSITETVASVGAVNILVGTDRYSNYPEKVVDMQNSGDITIVGDFTTPSYEKIIKTNPDIIFCDGSQYNHNMVSERLRNDGYKSVLLYTGENYDEILDNIFIIGQVIGYDLAAEDQIKTLDYAYTLMEDKLHDSPLTKEVDVMVALSPDMSPYVAGKYTYAGSVLSDFYGKNVFEDMNGWAHVNSEMIMKNNPSKIIILTYDYAATQEEYDMILQSLSNEWKGTDAYKNGEIYVICEAAGELSQRPGPRVVQMAELTARILNPDVFDDIKMNKFIGDDYYNYLSYTKEIGV